MSNRIHAFILTPIFLSTLGGCSNDTLFSPSASAPSSSTLSEAGEKQRSSDAVPENAEDQGITAPVSVGGAYLVCELDLNMDTPEGMAGIGCLVKDQATHAAFNFAADYDAALELDADGAPMSDVRVVDTSEAPNPWHWQFLIASENMKSAQATVKLTSKSFPDEGVVLHTALPPFGGTLVRTRLGFNFDDAGFGEPDRDFNDVVICLNGAFSLSVEEKGLVSLSDQIATVSYQKNASCTQEIQITYTEPDGVAATTFRDTVDQRTKNKSLNLKKGAPIEVRFVTGAPCQATAVDLFDKTSVRLRPEACGRLR